MAQWCAAAVVDTSFLSEEPDCCIPWGKLYVEIDLQVGVFDLWDGRTSYVLWDGRTSYFKYYRIEWLVTNHIAVLYLDTEPLGLGDLCACIARIRGQAFVLGFTLRNRLYRVGSFEEFWEKRYLDTLRREEEG